MVVVVVVMGPGVGGMGGCPGNRCTHNSAFTAPFPLYNVGGFFKGGMRAYTFSIVPPPPESTGAKLWPFAPHCLDILNVKIISGNYPSVNSLPIKVINLVVNILRTITLVET